MPVSAVRALPDVAGDEHVVELPASEELERLLAAALLRQDVCQAEAVVLLVLGQGARLLDVVDDLVLPVVDRLLADAVALPGAPARLAALMSATASLAARLRGPGRSALGEAPVWLVEAGSAGDPRATLMTPCLEAEGVSTSVLGRVPPAALAEMLADVAGPHLVVVCAGDEPLPREVLAACASTTPSARLVVLARGADPEAAEAAGAAAGARTVAEAVTAVLRLRGPLTRREQQVLALVAHGMSNKQIARELGVAATTVKAHLDRVYEKLEAPDRAAAAAIGLRAGWID